MSRLRRKPTIHCSLRDWQKIRAYTAACSVEINGFGFVDFDSESNQYQFRSPFIVEQAASDFGVRTDDAAWALYQEKLMQQGHDLSGLYLQWHSHVNLEAYFSSTDLANIERWAGDKLISLVLNKRGEYGCRLDIFKPRRLSLELAVKIELPSPSRYGIRKARTEVQAKVRQATSFETAEWREYD